MFPSGIAACPHCKHGHDRVGGRPGAHAALFYDQWYGNAPFDPAAYGAVPISPDDPAIWDLARRNVENTRKLFPSHTATVAAEARRLHAECFRGHWSHHLIQADVDALVAAGRLRDFEDHHPTAAEVNASRLGGFGHDAINAAICMMARCEREEVPYACVRCQGSGAIWPSEEVKKQHEDWVPTDPPLGEGYQLWGHGSANAPVSPVFATLDELCAWCETEATTFADFRATKEEWRRMLDGGVVHARMGNNIFL